MKRHALGHYERAAYEVVSNLRDGSEIQGRTGNIGELVGDYRYITALIYTLHPGRAERITSRLLVVLYITSKACSEPSFVLYISLGRRQSKFPCSRQYYKHQRRQSRACRGA